MTELLFRQDAYCTEAEGTVRSHLGEQGILLDRVLFYPTGGGQPGDTGQLTWDGGTCEIAATIRAGDGQVVLVPAQDAAMPPVGATVLQRLDWQQRYRHMRMHTALHLLSVVIPLPVTGGAIGTDRGRLDFDMPQTPDNREEIGAELDALVQRDLPVSEDWITDEELQAHPELVKTMSVSPPVGAGRIRLIRIGQGAEQVDLQPCGGTHVARTSEIGRLRLDKIEKKGRQNRRVSIHLEDVK